MAMPKAQCGTGHSAPPLQTPSHCCSSDLPCPKDESPQLVKHSQTLLLVTGMP